MTTESYWLASQEIKASKWKSECMAPLSFQITEHRQKCHESKWEQTENSRIGKDSDTRIVLYVLLLTFSPYFEQFEMSCSLLLYTEDPPHNSSSLCTQKKGGTFLIGLHTIYYLWQVNNIFVLIVFYWMLF